MLNTLERSNFEPFGQFQVMPATHMVWRSLCVAAEKSKPLEALASSKLTPNLMKHFLNIILIIAVAPVAPAQSTPQNTTGTSEILPTKAIDRSRYNLFNPTPPAQMRDSRQTVQTSRMGRTPLILVISCWNSDYSSTRATMVRMSDLMASPSAIRMFGSA